MQPVSDSQLASLEMAVSSYEEALTVEAARYLEGRGIGQAAADTHRLGVVDRPAPGHERYRGMLCIPYLTPAGEPLTVRFRCIQDHDHDEHRHGKYNSLNGDDTRMYNVGAIFTATDTIHVTEGELDAITLNMVGYPAVAIPGANNFKWRHQKMLAGFSRIWVWGDPDEAGAEFVNRLAKSLRQSRGVPLRDGDVNETYLKGGRSALFDLIGEAA